MQNAPYRQSSEAARAIALCCLGFLMPLGAASCRQTGSLGSTPPPPVSAIQIHGGNRNVLQGQSINLTVDVAPFGALPPTLVWSSSKGSVATVDSKGKVSGLAAGSTTIGATDGTHSDKVLVTVYALQPQILPTIAQAPFTYSGTAASLREGTPVPPAQDLLEARVISDLWVEIRLPELPYAAATVSDYSRYSITSTDDPDYSTAQTPARVYHRHFPEKAPYNPVSTSPVAWIKVLYRIYLQAPINRPFMRGKTYQIGVDPAVAAAGPFTVAYDGSGARELIHVNQVAYPPSGPKVAYLSYWLGDSFMDFSGATGFQVVSEADGSVAYSGNVTFSSAADAWSGADTYALDFSSFSGPGRYHLYVPGVGNSYPFDVGSGSFGQVIYTAVRALTMQRDGNHGLDRAGVTHWNRPPAHTDDAVEQSTGQRLDLVGGHMDAGDRGKYPANMGLTSETLLAAMRLFPDKVERLGDNLQIPESGNGIPDFVDETLYDLDELYRFEAYTHQDGTLPIYLRPADGGYEGGQPPEGEANRVLFDVTTGRVKTNTLLAAGVLAMAANDPLIKKYAPDRASDYLGAALRAFSGFEMHENDASYWYLLTGSYNMTRGKHEWSSEMVLAAANLLQATGDSKYVQRIADEWPSDPVSVMLDGFDPSGPWLGAFLSVYLCTDPKLPAGLSAQAAGAITAWADHLLGSFAKTGGVIYPGQTLTSVGWYFSGIIMGLPMVYAYGVTKNQYYLDKVADYWNYILGTNPRGASNISGLGSPETRPRWLVHEISLWECGKYQATSGAEGWAEMTPGIPAADIQNGEYDYWFYSDAWNRDRVEETYPNLSNVPVFYRYTDAWNATNEFTIPVVAAMAADALVFQE
jgi:hypothetical protein